MSAAATVTNPIRIFRPLDEAINLWLPLIFVGLFMAELYFAWSIYSYGYMWRSFFVDIVLLNLTHNAFTYAIIGLPELKPWIIEKGSGEKKKFWTRVLIINILLAISFFFLFLYGLKDIYVQSLFYFVNFSFPIHHALSQSFGLSLIYNKKITTVEKIKGIEKQERRLSLIFMTLIIVASLFITAMLGRMLDPEAQAVSMIWSGLKILLITSVFLLVAYMWVYPKELRKKKFIFSLRYFVWTLSAFSPSAALGTKVIHGVEYGFVTRRMISQSKKKNNMWLKIGAILVALVIVFAYFRFLALWALEENKELPVWVYALAAVSFAFTFSHYYLDRCLFQMRHKINRETSGKLLLED